MSKEFIKITNQQIYEKILEMDTKLNKVSSLGKVSRWMSSTALTLAIGIAVGHIL